VRPQVNDEKTFAEVIIDSAVNELDRPFHYSVPPELRERVEVGSLVLVPFSGRLSLGYVVGFPARPDVTRTRDVARVIDEPPVFDFDGQRLCRWIAARYMCPLSQAFRLVLPPGRGRRVKQMAALRVRLEDAVAALEGRPQALSDVAETLAAAGGPLDARTIQRHLGTPTGPSLASLEELGLVSRSFVLTEPRAAPKGRLMVRLLIPAGELVALELPRRQLDIASHLAARGGLQPQSDLLKETRTSASSLKSLAGKGVVAIENTEMLRRPRLTSGEAAPGAPTPNEHQAAAIETVVSAMEAGRPEVFLLEGVTGSGKTEVYLRCIARALEAGRGAIVLVPEISLTPQTLERFEQRFPGQVAVLHSRLAPGERFDQWRGIREGRYRVVVGARSALFAPVSKLGFIALDEEHESSYKSDTSPRYHAREVAIIRARMAGAVVVLGSATPSFEAVEDARSGRCVHLSLPDRIDNRPMPAIELVDMRETGGAGEVPLVSQALLDALSRTVQTGDQAILFLNRRGFANYMQCHTCGEILGCDDCEVSLCYHIKGDMLMCHHCSRTAHVPPKCPSCGSGPLKTFGAGTQRVEQEVARHLPGVSLIRMDADTTRTKDAHWELLGAFRRGEAQVLIGTQMIAKGLDIPGVTLVGVINADTALAVPDFRASERTYQLLTQVSGRAGRGLRPGRVIVQTYSPEHPAIAALTGDVGSFIDAELSVRRHALYPPYVELVNVLVTSTDLKAAARSAERMRKIFDGDLSGGGVTILGPAPAPLSRIRGVYRWHILLKCGELAPLREKIKLSVSRFYDYARTFPAGAEVRVSLDVDPSSLL